ncbi:MAG: DUF4159 domain-containing protein [Phycisphaeraceae bacterium]|nr:DUF4159 domain-containing protein [Phycisphaeraceae bacterium]
MVILLALAGPVTSAHAQGLGNFSPSGLSLKEIRQAIADGVDGLYEMEPEYTFGAAGAIMNPNRHHQRHKFGHHAIAAWAMLDAGESYQYPRLFRRVNWVLTADKPYVYDRAMRAQMLAELPVRRWEPWVHRERVWLNSALTNQGNFPFKYAGGRSTGWGDSANGQYGVLGLWGIERSGLTVPRQTWQKIDDFWRQTQQKTEGQLPAGWGLEPQANDADAPMTAGGVAVLTVTEKMLYGREFVNPDNNVTPHLRKGLAWLDENFDMNPGGSLPDWYYYMWTIQRVGRATGFRVFNDIDWYRVGTSQVLSNQTADGLWPRSGMMESELLSTAFALLYLAKANEPVAVTKIRYQRPGGEDENEANDDAEEEVAGSDFWGRWNNYPHDIWNFVTYVSDQFEYATTWQIMGLDQPAYSLIESPLLYLSTDEPVQLNDEQITNLKGFIEAGGLLIVNADGNEANTVRSYKSLAQELFGRDWEKVNPEHHIYNLHQQVGARVPMRMVDNGVRPLMIWMTRDIGKGLQTNDTARGDGFKALSNIYLYVTGKRFRRGRLENAYRVQQNSRPSISMPVARLQHDGNYDPEPGALKQLGAIMADGHNLDLQVEVIKPDKLNNHKMAFLTTTGAGSFSAAETSALRDWIKNGGTLWVDGAGGSREASNAAIGMVKKLFPNQPMKPVNSQHPLVNGVGIRGGQDVRTADYRLYTLVRMGKLNKPRLQTIEIDGRPAVIYSAEDLTCGLAGVHHWGIDGYTVNTARKLVINGVLAASR